MICATMIKGLKLTMNRYPIILKYHIIIPLTYISCGIRKISRYKGVNRLLSTCYLLSILGFAPLQGQSDGMTLLSNWDLDTLPAGGGGVYQYNDLWGYAANDREYAIIGSYEGTWFIDVTDPQNPVVADYEVGGYTASLWRDYKTYKHYCYGVADAGATSTLQIFDLATLPDSVTKIFDSDTFFVQAHNLFIDTASAILYACGTNNLSTGLILLDISSPQDIPSLIGNFDLGHYTHDIHVRNDTVYCFAANSGLKIYDFTNTSFVETISELSNYPDKGYNHSGWLNDQGDVMVFCDETHDKMVKVMDLTDITFPKVSSLFKSTLLCPETNSIAHNPFIRDSLVFVSYYHDGVQVFDISDPKYPFRVAYYDTEPADTSYSGGSGVWGVYPYLPSGRILASDVRNGLFVLDFAPTHNPDAWYVDTTTVTDDETGHCWENAFNSIVEAQPFLKEGDSLFIAQGLYIPDSTDRSKSFQFPDSSFILGGFPTGGSTLDLRNTQTFPTRFSGNINNIATHVDDSYHILKNPVHHTIWINGIHFQGGNHTGDMQYSSGSGIINQGTLYLDDCIFLDQQGDAPGYSISNNYKLFFSNSIIYQNNLLSGFASFLNHKNAYLKIDGIVQFKN